MRSVTGICVTVGTVVGGYLPTLWGGSALSLASVLTGALGGAAGVWLAVRLQS